MECCWPLVLGNGTRHMRYLQVFFLFSKIRGSLVEKCVQCQANDETEPCPLCFVFFFFFKSNVRVNVVIVFINTVLIGGLVQIRFVH